MTPSRHSEQTSIKFQLLGVAQLIEMQELSVPPFQRSYCWKPDEEVSAYWDDLSRAFRADDEYFLGTVVLTGESEDGRKVVIDGQQRLVTTSLLLAAIRNHLKERSSSKYKVVEDRFLITETLTSEGKDARLELNPDDNMQFREVTIGESSPGDAQFKDAPAIQKAFDFLNSKVGHVAEAAGSGAVDTLVNWSLSLRNRAKVAVIEVPTEADA